MIVCSVRKNDCHSERSEEPPHFAFCTCSCSCICIHPLPPGIVISTRGGALCRRSGETPAFCSCRCSCFCSCLRFRSAHPTTVISTEAVHSLIVGRVVEKSASLPWFPQATTPWPSSLLSFWVE